MLQMKGLNCFLLNKQRLCIHNHNHFYNSNYCEKRWRNTQLYQGAGVRNGFSTSNKESVTQLKPWVCFENGSMELLLFIHTCCQLFHIPLRRWTCSKITNSAESWLFEAELKSKRLTAIAFEMPSPSFFLNCLSKNVQGRVCRFFNVYLC